MPHPVRLSSPNVPEKSGNKQRPQEPLKLTMSETTSAPNEAGRVLGLELLAEARLAYLESRLSTERSRQAKVQLKKELIESREEHVQAHQTADLCRSTLATENLHEPPSELRADERDYLNFVARHLPESLRERIAGEVARALIITDREEGVARQSETSGLRREVGRPVKEDAETHPAVDQKSGSSTIEKGERKEAAHQEQAPVEIISPLPAEGLPKVTVQQTLPDEEAARLLVACELSRGRVAVLRAEEQRLAVMPHNWPSPVQRLTLAQVERQIKAGLEQKKNVAEVLTVRERVREEIAAERVALPSRRQAAEVDTSRLENLLSREGAERARLGLKMPDADPTAEEENEMTRNAVGSCDSQLLQRVYEIQLAQALRVGQSGGNALEMIRNLEERMVGIELMAEVRERTGQRNLAEATAHPEKIALPAKDETGRDIVRALAEVNSQNVVTGFLKKMVEGKAGRQLRDQLVQSKDAYISYLAADLVNLKAFHEAAQAVTSTCRERGREIGIQIQAAPILTRAEIAEVRDEARFLVGGADRWLKVAAQAQQVADEKDRLSHPRPPSREELVPDQATVAKREAARAQIEQARAERDRVARLVPLPLRHPIERETSRPMGTPEREDNSSPKRPGRGRSR